MSEYDLGWEWGREAGYESRDEEVRDLEDKIEKLTAALNRLLLNYSAALPEGKKNQRSIAEARKLLGLDERNDSNVATDDG